MEFFPSCGWVSTTAWILHMDVNEMLGEKAKWELQKIAMSNFEQILEA